MPRRNYRPRTPPLPRTIRTAHDTYKARSRRILNWLGHKALTDSEVYFKVVRYPRWSPLHKSIVSRAEGLVGRHMQCDEKILELFRSAISNRQIVTAHYNGLPDEYQTDELRESTSRYENFTGLLIQAKTFSFTDNHDHRRNPQRHWSQSGHRLSALTGFADSLTKQELDSIDVDFTAENV
jgi:hypothetical protein